MKIVNDDNTDVEFSFLICTYRPQWDKLRMTLKSCLLQKNCNYKLVVADDGSDNNLFDEIREYLKRKNFTDYELVGSACNLGTVKNVMQGLQACNGEYVKLISPGDYMHGSQTMRNWLDFMNDHDDCAMSFGDAIYYHFENDEIITTAEYAHPQSVNVCDEKTAIRNYLMHNDICLGASTLQRRQVWMKYLNLIVDKVVYAEDNTYRIMKYCGEKFMHFPHSIMLYEFGSGISTNGSDKWAKRLRKDWKTTDRIMLSIRPCQEAKELALAEYLQKTLQRGWKGRFQRLLLYPSKVLFRLRTHFIPRRTPIVVDDGFMQQLLKE